MSHNAGSGRGFSCGNYRARPQNRAASAFASSSVLGSSRVVSQSRASGSISHSADASFTQARYGAAVTDPSPNRRSGAHLGARVLWFMSMGLGPLDLVTIQVRNWTEAVEWYTEVLGLPIITSDEDDGFCMFGTDGAALALASDHPDQAAGTGENRLAPAFRVADLDSTLERLRSLGVRVDSHIDGEDEGYRLARIYDPEGNRLHLYCYD